ncbi:MAG: cysteine desulfurase family protein [Patescibacteria group bacterium]|jgi:cysteine desulfurase|nr:cysteine desulfurase family protein [Patescibacteria group bacterium]
MKPIYLDHSATTPVDKKVLEKMIPYFSDVYGNSSSLHSFGREAIIAVDKSRKQIADFLNCDFSEIFFTSGATEANNLAIFGLVNSFLARGFKKPHIITTEIEHPATLEPIERLVRDGLIEVRYLKPNKKGIVNANDLLDAVQDNTLLVSVMHVNSEIGSIQPIRAIGKNIKKINERKQKDWQKKRISERGERPQQIYFHTDATQAINYLNSDVVWNYVDMLSMSGHKIYGPKGIGALYVRTGIPLRAVQLGGHQEMDKRSGTLNVSGIVGIGEAVAQLTEKNIENNSKKIARLRDMFVEGVLKSIPGASLTTDREKSVPSHAHFIFPGIEGESILIALDLEGVAVATGSACASARLEASSVLLAMGIKKEIAHSSIRFTFGKYNTEAEVKRVLKVLPPIIKRLKDMAPNLPGITK